MNMNNNKEMFRETQYECTGNCFCLSSSSTENNNNEKKERKVVSVAASKGVKIFLTGISTTMVYSLAKKTFNNHCVKTFEDTCEKHYIQSEIDDCQEKPEKGEYVFVDQKTGEKKKDEEMKGFRKYACNGHCVNVPTSPGEVTGLDELMKIGYEKIGLCEAIKFEDHLALKHHPDEPPAQFINQARLQFAMGPLSEHCRKNSMLDGEKLFPPTLKKKAKLAIEKLKSDKKVSEHHDKLSMNIPFCIGGMLEMNPATGQIGVKSLANVDCLPIE